jgi:hypothetical protein
MFIAVSAFSVGHVQRNSTLRTKGNELYSQCLQSLRRALEPPKLAKRGNVMYDLETTAFTMVLYEVGRH